MIEIEEQFHKNPSDEELFEQLGAHYREEKKWEKLTEIYQEHATAIQSVDPQKSAQHYAYSAGICITYLSNPVKAESLWRKVLSLDPGNTKVASELETLYLKEKKWKELDALYEKLCLNLEDSSASLLWLNKAAKTLSSTEEFWPKAQKYYEKALEIDKSDIRTYHLLADLLKSKGLLAECIAVWKNLAKVTDHQGRDRLYLQIGETYEEIGEKAQAASYYRQITHRRYQKDVLERLQKIYQNDGSNLDLVLTQKLDQMETKEEKIPVYLELAQLKENSGDPDGAIALYEKVLSLEPKRLDIFDFISSLLWEQNRLDEWLKCHQKKNEQLDSTQEKVYNLHRCAVNLKSQEQKEESVDHLITIYEKILQMAPEDKVAMDALISIYRTLRRYEDLKRVLLDKSKYSPIAEKVGVYFQIAKLLSESLNQQEEASVYYQRVIKMQGDHQATLQDLRKQYSQRENYQELLRVIEDEVRLQTSPSENLYHEMGEIYRDKLNNQSKASQFFEKALSSNPHHLPSYHALREIYKNTKRWEDYIQVAEKELTYTKVSAKTSQLHFDLSQVYLNQGENKAAEKHLGKVLLYRPEDGPSLECLAELYEKQERWEDYVVVLQNIILFDTKSEETAARYESLASLHEEKLDAPEKAIFFYEKALFLNPFHENILLQLERLYSQEKRDDDFLKILKKRVSLTTDHDTAAEIYKQIGTLYQEKDSLSQAAKYFEKALEKKPNSGEVLKQLVKIYEKEERFPELLTALERLLTQEEKKEQSRLYLRLGKLAQDKLNSCTQAIYYFEQALLLEEKEKHEATDHLIKIYEQEEFWVPLTTLYWQKYRVSSNPEEKTTLLLKLAQLYEELEHPNKLRQVYSKLLYLSPEDSATLEKLEKVCLQLEEWGTLASIYENRLLQLPPEKQISENLKLGQIYEEKLGQLEKAIACYEKAFQEEPEKETLDRLLSLYIFEGKYESALEILANQAQGEEDPEIEAQLLVEQGKIYYQHLQNREKAVFCLEESLNLFPTSLSALNLLEKIYREEENTLFLLQVLEQKTSLLSLEETLPLYIEMARLWENKEAQPEKAMSTLESAYENFPQSIEIKSLLELLYRKEELWEKLAGLYQEQAAKQNSSFEKASFLFLQGKLYEKEMQMPNQAASLYVQVLKLTPDYLPAIKSLQTIYLQDNRLTALAESYLAELAVSDISPKRRIALHIKCAEIFEKELDKQDWAYNHYEQILKLDSHSLIAVRGLQTLCRKGMKKEQLVHMLIIELGIERNVHRLFHVHQELAQLYLKDLSENEEAIIHYTHAHNCKPEDKNILKQLKEILKQEEKWDSYASYLEKEIPFVEGERKQKIHIELSQIYQEKIGVASQAIFHLEAAFSMGNLPLTSLHALEKLYQEEQEKKEGQDESSEYAKKLLACYEKELTLVEESHGRQKVYLAMSQIYHENLGQTEKAIFCLESILQLQSNHKKAINLLAQLYTASSKWDKLAQLYNQRFHRVKSNKEKEDLLAKIAAIYEKKGQDPLKSLGYYQMIISLNRENISALRGIRRILTEKEDWHRVIDYLEQEALLLTGKECANTYLKIARIWEFKIKLVPQAVRAYVRVLQIYYHNSTAEHTISLLRSIKDFETLSLILKKMIRRLSHPKTKVEKLCELGAIYFTELKRPVQALEVYQEALKHQPKNKKILDSLEKVYAHEGQWEELVEIKEEKLQLLKDISQVHLQHIELGEIYVNFIYDERQAITHYERALEISSSDIPLIHQLQKLYKNWGYFKRYIDLCEQEISYCDDSEREINLWQEIAFVSEGRLFDESKAVESLEEILQIDHQHEHSVNKLIQLYQQLEDYVNLTRIYEKKIEWATEKKEENLVTQLQLETGKIYHEKLSESDKAQKLFEKVLLQVPDNAFALKALEEIYEGAGSPEKQVHILRKKIELAQDERIKIKLYWQLGKIYEESLASPEEALETYLKLEEYEKENLNLLISIKNLYKKLEDNSSWLSTQTRIINHAKNSEEKASLYLESAYFLETENPSLAIDYLEKASKEKLNYFPALSLLTKLLVEEKSWEKALQALDQWIEGETDVQQRAQLFLRKAEIYQNELSLIDKTIDNLESCLAENMQHFRAASLLAEIYYGLKVWEKAEPLYEQILYQQESLSQAEIYARLGDIALHSKRPDVAIVRYQKCLDLKSDHFSALEALGSIYYDNQQWEQALLVYMKLNSQEQVEKREIELRLAVIKDKMGMVEGAIEGYLAVVDENPNDFLTWEALGRLYHEREDLEKSLECFRQMQENAQDPVIKETGYFWTTRICEKLGNYSLAIQNCVALLELSPEKIESQKKLLQLYQENQEWEKALKVTNELLAKAENNYEKLEQLIHKGDIYWQGYGDTEKAVFSYREALDIIPTYTTAIEKIAAIYTEQEDWTKIIQIYQDFIPQYPSQLRGKLIPLLVSKAEIFHLKLGNDEQATEIYEKIIEIDPEHEAAHVALANIWGNSLENASQAILQHLYLISIDPFRVSSYHDLCRLYIESRDYDKAYLCCQALETLGKLNATEESFLKQVPLRVPSGWLDTWTIENFVRKSDRDTLYEIMSSIDSFAEKAYSPTLEENLQSLRREKLQNDEEKEISDTIHEVMHLFGIENLQLYYHPESREVRVENTLPPSLIVGLKRWRQLNKKEKYFVLGKRLFYIACQHIMALKLSPEDYSDYVTQLVEAFAETGTSQSEEEEAVSKRIRNSLPRRIRKQLEERMDILTEIYQADTRKFLEVLSRAANNSALLIADSLSASLRAYQQEKQEDVVEWESWRKDLNIREIFLFNISDEHNRLRRELGLEIKWIK